MILQITCHILSLSFLEGPTCGQLNHNKPWRLRQAQHTHTPATSCKKTACRRAKKTRSVESYLWLILLVNFHGPHVSWFYGILVEKKTLICGTPCQPSGCLENHGAKVGIRPPKLWRCSNSWTHQANWWMIIPCDSSVFPAGQRQAPSQSDPNKGFPWEKKSHHSVPIMLVYSLYSHLTWSNITPLIKKNMKDVFVE